LSYNVKTGLSGCSSLRSNELWRAPRVTPNLTKKKPPAGMKSWGLAEGRKKVEKKKRPSKEVRSQNITTSRKSQKKELWIKKGGKKGGGPLPKASGKVSGGNQIFHGSGSCNVFRAQKTKKTEFAAMIRVTREVLSDAPA